MHVCVLIINHTQQLIIFGGAPFCHHMICHLSSKDLNQTSLENMFVCIFADFEAFRFCVVFSVAMFLLVAKFVLGENVGREASFWGQLIPQRAISCGLCLNDFQKS